MLRDLPKGALRRLVVHHGLGAEGVLPLAILGALVLAVGVHSTKSCGGAQVVLATGYCPTKALRWGQALRGSGCLSCQDPVVGSRLCNVVGGVSLTKALR